MCLCPKTIVQGRWDYSNFIFPIDMLYQKPFHMTFCANTQICSPIWQRQGNGNWNNWFPNLVMIPFHPDFIVDQRYTKYVYQGRQSWSALTVINSCACFSSKHIHNQTKKKGYKSCIKSNNYEIKIDVCIRCIPDWMH